MPDSSGVNRVTGQPLTDWDHVQQSIEVILTTPIGSRVMRREFGAEVPFIVGKPMTDQVIMAYRAAAANALAVWEPRFDLTRVDVDGSSDGTLQMIIGGTYRPRGHLGDPTPAGDRIFSFPLLAG